MITIFNRRELLITMDIKRRGEVCDILKDNGIDYDVKTTNLESAGPIGAARGNRGSLGMNQQFSYEYKIYVSKADYEKAKLLVRRR